MLSDEKTNDITRYTAIAISCDYPLYRHRVSFIKTWFTLMNRILNFH